MNSNTVYKYLVVENVIDVCEGIERRMKPFAQWHSIGYSTGINDAVEKIKTIKPQLIFLDWSLNGGSAFEVLQQVANIPQYDPYIIFNTGYQADNPEIPQEIINNYKIDKYLVKPLWENLRNNLAVYIKEAEGKATATGNKNKPIWLCDSEGAKHPVELCNLICVCQHPTEQRYRNFYFSNKEKPFVTPLKWQECNEMLTANNINFFTTKHRSHLVVKEHIEKYERPFIRLRNFSFKIEVVKESLRAFEHWLNKS